MKTNKNKNFWFWFFIIVGVILSISPILIDVYTKGLLNSGPLFLEYLRYAIWIISLLLIIGPCIKRMGKLVLATKGIIESANVMTDKFNELALWRKNEKIEKIRITVSDLDDYLILLPLHLSKRYLKGMGVDIRTRCCGSDQKAIEELVSGNSNFAITDPHYLKEYKNPDLILLSPLITNSPMWWMERDGGNTDKKRNVIRVFSYDDFVEKRDGCGKEITDTFTSRLLKKQIKKLKESARGKIEKIEILTIQKVVSELCKELEKINFSTRDSSLISNYKGAKGGKGLVGLREDVDKISAFECLLFSCRETDNTEVATIMTNYFSKIDYFLVTEPDCSFIKKLGYTECNASLNNAPIFTAVITTRTYLKEFPVASLKMLRGLRNGILKTNLLLMKQDTAMIKKAFEDAFDEQKVQLFKTAFGSIQSFVLDSTFFPNDLILLDREKKFVETDDKDIENIIDKYKDSNYGDALLSRSEKKGRTSDLSDDNIKFIIQGLGYDC